MKVLILTKFCLIGCFTVVAQNDIQSALNSRFAGYIGTGVNTSICNSSTYASNNSSLGVFPINSLYSSGSGSSSPSRNAYFTTPNSGAFFKEPVSTLSVQTGEDAYYRSIPVAGSCDLISDKTAWYFIDNPNTSGIGYRIATYNHLALSNVRTAIAIYKVNNAVAVNLNEFYGLDNMGNTVPRFLKLAVVNNEQGGVIDLSNPGNVLNSGMPFANQGSTFIIPKPLAYSRRQSGSRYVSDYMCSLFSTSEIAAANIESPMGYVLNMFDPNYLNKAYIELYNPAPNERYLVQILVYPDCDISDDSFYTLAFHAELLSSDSYADNGTGIFIFDEPKYIFPKYEYHSNASSTAVSALSYSTERPFVFDGLSTFTRIDPRSSDPELGYRKWSNTTSLINIGQSSLFSLHRTGNILYGATFGSSNSYPGGSWLIGPTSIKGWSTGLGSANMDNTPGINDDNRGYNFNFYYGFYNGANLIMHLSTYSAHASYANVDIPFMNVWSGSPQPPAIVPDNNVNEEVSIYPNPTAGQLHLKFLIQNDDDYFVEIFNLDGKKVQDLLGNQSELNRVLQTDLKLSNGTYLLTITNLTSKKISELRFVVQN